MFLLPEKSTLVEDKLFQPLHLKISYLNQRRRQNLVKMEHFAKIVKDSLSGLKQFMTTEILLKMMKNAFYFMLKTHFVLEIFKYLSWLFVYSEKQLRRLKLISKFLTPTDWTANSYNTNIAQYLKKKRQTRGKKFGRLVKYNVTNSFFGNHAEIEARRLGLGVFLIFKTLYLR